MVVDTSKITQKDVGEYIIRTAISLDGNDFKIESQSFKLKITSEDDVATNQTGSKANEAKTADEYNESND